MKEERPKKVALIVMSGDLERLFGAFVIATGAAASGMEVSMFFTFWGLRALKSGKRTGRSILGRLIGFFERGDLRRASPGRYSFFGLGRWLFRKMMRAHRVPDLVELRQMAIDLGVKFYGCEMSLQVMEIPREALIPEVKACVGVAHFLAEATQADLTLFI
ncbi:MAG: DsrE/DsrF/DrsH-like family protein [Candidatus Aminicenantes bacterium]|nr:DsrE/DsrF/DrsH-like family protein [Candidatus Aminicenantes bacterium]